MGESARWDEGKLLVERAVDPHPTRGGQRKEARPARSVTVNLAASPRGWLHAHGQVSRRQYEAGERLRFDWERSQLDPRVTMTWDAAPISGSRAGAARAPDLNGAQIDARGRLDAAVGAAGPCLSDIIVAHRLCRGGPAPAETALGWPARAGKLVVGLALDRVADDYRLP